MKITKLIVIMGIVIGVCDAFVYGHRSIQMSNQTSNATFKAGDLKFHSTLIGCGKDQYRWNDHDLEPLTGYYYERMNGARCSGECYDRFSINGHEFNLLDVCFGGCCDMNLVITDDGVTINGKSPSSYGDFVGFMKNAGIALAQPFKDVAGFMEKALASTVIWMKNAGVFIVNIYKTEAYIYKAIFTGDEEDLNKQLNNAENITKHFAVQTGKALELFVKNVTSTLSNMVTNPEKANYCSFSATSTHANMPKTVADEGVKAQDKEGLIPYIEKYAPISYLDKYELFYPIWVDEYFTSPTTRLKSKSTGKEYLKGKLTFEFMYDLYTKCESGNDDLYFDNDDCVKYGSNPMKNCAVAGQCGPARSPQDRAALTTPLYVVTSETGDKIYIEYLYFYGLNGPYDIGPFEGDVKFKDIAGSIQNLHESDLEHISVELDKNSKKLLRVYFGSHGKTEGFWIDAYGKDGKLNPEIIWEGTHPVAFIAHGGHGLYPKEGTYVRIFGMANDINSKGQRWDPANLIRVYKEDDERFDPKTMGWLYWPGKMGAHGIDGASGKSWFVEGPQVGDIGRDPKADPNFCPNPSGDFLVGDTKYDDCIADKVPQATIPD